MSNNIRGLLRDATLAMLAVAGLGGMLYHNGESHILQSPRTAISGGIGAVVVESVMLRYPDVTRTVWERPSTQVGSLTILLAVGHNFMQHDKVWSVGVCWWGLVTYLGMVMYVLSGRENPVSQALGSRTN
jgi:hypothetical protein